MGAGSRAVSQFLLGKFFKDSFIGFLTKSLPEGFACSYYQAKEGEQVSDHVTIWHTETGFGMASIFADSSEKECMRIVVFGDRIVKLEHEQQNLIRKALRDLANDLVLRPVCK